MSNKKNTQEEDALKYAKEQFIFHSEQAKKWELFLSASNHSTNGNGIPTTVAISPMPKRKNSQFLDLLNTAFKKSDNDLKLKRQWYDAVKILGFKNSFITFSTSLGELVKSNDVVRIDIPDAPNKTKYWYCSKDCLDDNKQLKKEYKAKLEKKIDSMNKKEHELFAS